MQPVKNHTVIQGSSTVTVQKPKPTPVPSQRNKRVFANNGRRGCSSCGRAR